MIRPLLLLAALAPTALTLTALAMPGAAGAAELRAIPKPYHGHWSLTAEQCAPGKPDDANVRVGARIYQDYSMKMDVRYVTDMGSDGDPDQIIIGGPVGGGSDRYDGVKRLALLDGGTVLGVGEGEDHSLYVRCKS